MDAQILPLPSSAAPTLHTARTVTDRYLSRCKLAPKTVTAYRRQNAAYATWLATHPDAHPDAFTDQVGAEAAVTAWRRHLLTSGASPSSVNQTLAAVTLLYEHGAGIRIKVKRARVPRPGDPDALTPPSRARSSGPPPAAAPATPPSSPSCSTPAPASPNASA